MWNVFKTREDKEFAALSGTAIGLGAVLTTGLFDLARHAATQPDALKYVAVGGLTLALTANAVFAFIKLRR